MRTRDVILADLARTNGRELPTGRGARTRLLLTGLGSVKGLAVIGVRVSGHFGRRSAFLGAVVKQLTHVVTGADIGYHATIGPGMRLVHPTGIVIANEAVIGKRCTLHSGITLGGSPDGAPVLGDDVRIAPGARILGAVRVGDGCHIAANAVVHRTIPGERLVLGGVPAKVLREV